MIEWREVAGVLLPWHVKFDPDEARDEQGRWTEGGGGGRAPATPKFHPRTAAVNKAIAGMRALGTKDDPAASLPVFTAAEIAEHVPERELHTRFPNTQFDFKYIAPEYVNPISAQITRLLTWFPDVKLPYVGNEDGRPMSADDYFTPPKGASVWAYADGSHGIVLESRWWNNPTGFQNSLDASVNMGWHPAGGNTPASVVTHEFGHQVHDWLLTQPQSVSVLPAVYSSGIGVVPFTTQEFMHRGGTVVDRLSLSKYANSHDNEAFAEGFMTLMHQPKEQWGKYTKREKVLLETIGDTRNWLPPADATGSPASKSPTPEALLKVRDGRAWSWVPDIRDQEWANPGIAGGPRDVTAQWYAASDNLKEKLGIGWGMDPWSQPD